MSDDITDHKVHVPITKEEFHALLIVTDAQGRRIFQQLRRTLRKELIAVGRLKDDKDNS